MGPRRGSCAHKALGVVRGAPRSAHPDLGDARGVLGRPSRGRSVRSTLVPAPSRSTFPSGLGGHASWDRGDPSDAKPAMGSNGASDRSGRCARPARCRRDRCTPSQAPHREGRGPLRRFLGRGCGEDLPSYVVVTGQLSAPPIASKPGNRSRGDGRRDLHGCWVLGLIGPPRPVDEDRVPPEPERGLRASTFARLRPLP